MIQKIHLGNPIQLLELREADFEKEAKIYLDHDATLKSAKQPSTQVVKMAVHVFASLNISSFA